MDKQELLKGELIGKYVCIAKSENKSLIGVAGKIVDETKSLLTLRTEKGDKKIIKSQVIFGFCEDDNYEIKIKIDGKLLVGRPEDRIKSKVKNERN